MEAYLVVSFLIKTNLVMVHVVAPWLLKPLHEQSTSPANWHFP